MKRWLTLTFLLWLTFAMLIRFSIEFGHSRPYSDSFDALGIQDCAGIPCVQGVVLGVTSLADLKSRYAGRAGTNIFANSIETGNDTFMHITFWTNISDDQIARVTEISIFTYYPVPKLLIGSLIARYGMPCRVQVYVTGSIVLIFPSLTANVPISRYFPDPDTRLYSEQTVDQITFSARSNSCVLEATDLSLDIDHHEMPWLGFAELDKYYFARYPR